jgi:hypothetical protein
MGQFLKGALGILSVIILSILLSLSILSFSFAQSAKPEVIKSLVKGIVEVSLSDKASLEKSYSQFSMACYNREFLELPLDEQNKTSIKIICKEIREGNSGKLTEILADSFFNKVYYADYNCAYLDCINKISSPLFFFSKSGSSLLAIFSWVILAAFLLLLALLSLVIRLKVVASVFIFNGISSLLFLVKENIKNQVNSSTMLKYFEPFVSSVIYYTALISLGCLVIGLILLLVHRILNAKENKPSKKKK